jgi:hypothetical protein
MDNPADTLDQADEDILTSTVSDDAMEAAAGGWGTTPMCTSVAVPCPTSEFPCLTSTVSDEEMEAAADTEKSPVRPARRRTYRSMTHERYHCPHRHPRPG